MARYEPNFGGEPRPWPEVIAFVAIAVLYVSAVAWVFYSIGAYFLFP